MKGNIKLICNEGKQLEILKDDSVSHREGFLMKDDFVSKSQGCVFVVCSCIQDPPFHSCSERPKGEEEVPITNFSMKNCADGENKMDNILSSMIFLLKTFLVKYV